MKRWIEWGGAKLRKRRVVLTADLFLTDLKYSSERVRIFLWCQCRDFYCIFSYNSEMIVALSLERLEANCRLCRIQMASPQFSRKYADVTETVLHKSVCCEPLKIFYYRWERLSCSSIPAQTDFSSILIEVGSLHSSFKISALATESLSTLFGILIYCFFSWTAVFWVCNLLSLMWAFSVELKVWWLHLLSRLKKAQNSNLFKTQFVCLFMYF